MTDTLFLHSLTNFREIVLETLARSGARRIVEVGAESGTFTRDLLDLARRTGGRLITIDPAPEPEAVEFFERHLGDPHFEFLRQTSLEALPALAGIDAYVIDGDHNYHTVRAELEIIGARHRAEGRPLLVFEHDVAWPCGRRDFYYAPDLIPEDSRQPYSREGGVVPGQPGLVPGGWGDGSGIGLALEAGGPRNGVRTAIEDFLAEHQELCFATIPAVLGLGVLYSREAPWAAQVAELLRPLADNPLLERMERNRVELTCRVLHGMRDARAVPAVPAGYLWGASLLEMFSVDSRAAFDRLFEQRLATRLREQERLVPPGLEEFTLPGFCVVCGQQRMLVTDYMFAGAGADGRRVPAWRERQVCTCGLNCRQRSGFHVLTQLPRLTPDSDVLCTEPGAAFERVRGAFPRAVAGIDMGERVPQGRSAAPGIRNEDVTRLTFPGASLDAVFSLDVLDRVPDYRRALREFARCLRPDGWLVLTVPFHFERNETREGVAPAAGQAVRPHEFGWDLLAALRDAGFVDAEVAVFTAPHYGYVGLQYVIAASRAPAAGGGDSIRDEGAEHAGR